MSPFPTDILLVAANRLSTPHLPVGIAFVAQAVANAGFKYAFADVTTESDASIIRRITLAKPRYVGIGTMTHEVFKNYHFIQEIKRLMPDIKVILGGPHVLAESQKIFSDCPEVDYAVQGEGEETIVSLLRGEHPEDIPQLIYRNEKGEIVKNAMRLLDISTVDFPKYEKIPLHKYPQQMNIASSRGCVQSCIFCGARRFLGRVWRANSSGRMFEEFFYWYEKGYRRFYFSDSLFSKDKERIVAFCDKVQKSGIKDASFKSDGIRADNLDFALLKIMKKTGFKNITMGVESVSDTVLKFMAKGENFAQIDGAIQMANVLDYEIGCFFILGSPVETLEDMAASLAFPYKYSNIIMVHYHKLTAVPGTPYFDYALRRGLVDEKTRYGMADDFWKIAKYGTDHTSREELQNAINLGMEVQTFIEFRAQVLKLIKSQGYPTPPADRLNALAADLYKEQCGKTAPLPPFDACLRKTQSELSG